MRRLTMAGAVLAALSSVFDANDPPLTRRRRHKGNKYKPHQGARECQRRRDQMASGQLTGLFA